MSRLILLALVAWIVSCASDERTYRLDAGTTEAEAADFSESAARMNAYMPDDEQLRLGPAGAWLVTFTNDLRANKDGRTCGRHADASNDCRYDHWIRIRRSMPDTRKVALGEHEIGHSLGLEHVADTSSVMHPDIGGVDLTAWDVAEGQRVGAFAMVIGSKVIL